MDNPIQSIADRTIDEVAAAEILHVKAGTMRAWRHLRRGPRYLSYSRKCVRYRLRDLLEYQELSVREAGAARGQDRSAVG